MKITYLGLINNIEYQAQIDNEFEEYKKSTLLDFILNKIIKFIDIQKEIIEPHINEGNYQDIFKQLCIKIQTQLKVADELCSIAISYYQKNENHRSIPFSKIYNGKKELGFRTEYLEKTDKEKCTRILDDLEFDALNPRWLDNYETIVQHQKIISRLSANLNGESLIYQISPFHTKKEKKIKGLNVTIQKSSTQEFFLSMIHNLKQVRQIRWLSWQENYLYEKIVEAAGSFQKSCCYMIALPEFFFVDHNNNEKPGMPTGYVKPFYEDTARHFMRLSGATIKWMTGNPLGHRRLVDLSMNENVIIFAGTMIWKSLEVHEIYCDGASASSKPKPGYEKICTDTYYNTAIVFYRGICYHLWDKQFVSPVDGTEGVKVIHKHEEPEPEPKQEYEYIKSSLTTQYGTGSPTLNCMFEGTNIKFLLSICLDLAELSKISYQGIDIQVVISSGIRVCMEYVKAGQFILYCDGELQTAQCYLPVPDPTPGCEFFPKKLEFQIKHPFTVTEFEYPQMIQTSVNTNNKGTKECLFYKKFQNEGLRINENTEAAALLTEKDSICVISEMTTSLYAMPSEEDPQAGMLKLEDNGDVLELPVLVSPEIDPETGEERLLVNLPLSCDHRFTLEEMQLFTGNFSNDFFSMLNIALHPAATFKLLFYESGHRVYEIDCPIEGELSVVEGFITLDSASLSAYRYDDSGRLTLSAVLNIAGFSMEFGVISGAENLLQGYLRPAAPQTAFPSVGQLASWLLGDEAESLSTLEGFGLLDLAISSINLFLKIEEKIEFSELKLGTRITAAGLTFDTELCILGKNLSGQLVKDRTASVADIVASFFTHTSPPVLPDALCSLYFTTGTFEADILKNTYSLDIGLSGSWDCGLVTLNNLEIILKKNENSQSVAFSGAITLFETLTVNLSIQELNGQWSISGGASVPKDKTIYDVCQSFGWESPDVFKNITVSGIYLDVTPSAGNYQFKCHGALSFAGMILILDVAAQKNQGQAIYRGEMTFASPNQETSLVVNSMFLIEFIYGPNQNLLQLEWQPDPEFKFTDFCAILGFENFSVPDFLNLALNKLSGSIDFNNGGFTFAALTTDGHCVYLESFIAEKGREYRFALLLDFDLHLSSLPVVGERVEMLDKVHLYQLKSILLTSAVEHLTIDEMGITDLSLERGLYFSSNLFLGDRNIPLSLPLPMAQNNLLESNQSSTKMLDINKSVGPFSLRRIGVSYADSTLTFLMDAALNESALNFELDGLGIGYQIADKKPTFMLEGLSLDIKNSAVSIGGSFRKVDAQTYRGSLLIRMANIGVTAYGAYTASPSPSVFAFALLRANLGGPPCFFITGIAAGFGYCRDLCIPEMDKLEEFSLIQAANGKITGDAIFNDEKTYFPPRVGESWVAAGILFNSFKLIDSYALLSVKFGNETEITLLGRSLLDVPYGSANPIGHAALLLKAAFKPGSGLISIEAALSSDSYILSKDCHLSGGFAFYTWYSGQHAGDFVVTLGGYKNSYSKPDHYPDVRRLGLDWKISKALSVQGNIYFALTPSAMMAGGALKMQFNTSCVQAWFEAHVDIFIQWKPYAYEFNIGISLGVRVDLKLFSFKLELGCDISIWGPEFSGKAHIKLWCISFTISFGSSKASVDTRIETDEFVGSFLPPATASNGTNANQYASCTISASDGLLKEYEIDGEKCWNLCAENFKLASCSTVPAQSILLTTDTSERVYTYSHHEVISLRPCGFDVLDAWQEVVLERVDGVKIDRSFIVTPIEENLPTALWGPEGYEEETLLAGTGISIEPRAINYYEFTFTEAFNQVQYDIEIPKTPKLPCIEYDQSQAYNYLSEIDKTCEQRRQLFENMDIAFSDIHVEALAGDPGGFFTETPRIVTIGGMRR